MVRCCDPLARITAFAPIRTSSPITMVMPPSLFRQVAAADGHPVQDRGACADLHVRVNHEPGRRVGENKP
jgi:hypothetical protein